MNTTHKNEGEEHPPSTVVTALLAGEDDLLRHLLAAGADPNERDEQRRPALSLAARLGRTEAVRQLLAAGANACTESRARETALFLAAAGGHEQIFLMLLEAGANPHVVKSNRANLYHAAAAGGSPLILGRLMQESVYGLNERQRQGRTPLMLAVRRDHVDAARMLLENGANPCQRVHRRKRIIDLARSDEMRRLLVEASKDILAELPRKLAYHPAAEVKGADEKAGKRETWGAPPDLVDAVYGNDLEAVRRALASGQSPNTEVDWEGWTVLHCAAQRGYADIVRALLDAGADPNVSYYWHEETPLHMAAFNGDPETVRALIEGGADLNAQLWEYETRYDGDDGSESALDIVVERGHREAAHLLLKAGACYRSSNSNGYTPLLRALANGESRLAMEIAALGPEVLEAADQCGITPLVASVRLRDAEVLRCLLELGANPDTPSIRGNTALHEAIAIGFVPAIDLLLSGGAAVDLANSAGEEALHVAARQGDIDTARALLLLGADPARCNAAGQNAAELATRPILRELLEKHITPILQNTHHE